MGGSCTIYFRNVTNKIVLTWKFISPDNKEKKTVINLFVILRVFLVQVISCLVNFLAVSSKRVQIFEGKYNICLGKQLSVPERAGVTSLEGKKPPS